MKDLGKFIMLGGFLLVLVGFILWAGGDKFKWLGNLPGDIRVKKPGFSLFVPITTMIVISVAISVILWIIRKFF